MDVYFAESFMLNTRLGDAPRTNKTIPPNFRFLTNRSISARVSFITYVRRNLSEYYF